MKQITNAMFQLLPTQHCVIRRVARFKNARE